MCSVVFFKCKLSNSNLEFELDHTNLQIQKHSTANKLGKMAGLSIKINRLLLTEKMNGMFHPEPLCSIKFNTLVLNPENNFQDIQDKPAPSF